MFGHQSTELHMIGVAYGLFRPFRTFRLEQDLSSSPEFLSHLIASYLFEDEKSTPQVKRLNLLDQGIDPYGSIFQRARTSNDACRRMHGFLGLQHLTNLRSSLSDATPSVAKR